MDIYLKNVEVRNLFGWLNQKIEFEKDLTIIYGSNGTGKTSILHIIANLLNGSIPRFYNIDFELIRISTNKNGVLELKKERKNSDDFSVYLNNRRLEKPFDIRMRRNVGRSRRERMILHDGIRIKEEQFLEEEAYQEIIENYERDTLRKLKNELGLTSPTYFPAFRGMIEAWASINLRNTQKSISTRRDIQFVRALRQFDVTELSRNLFGEFVPKITYPSILEIEVRLSRFISRVITELSLKNQELLSNFFSDVLDESIENRKYNTSIEESLMNIEKLYERLKTSELNKYTSLTSAFKEISEKLSKINRDDLTPFVNILVHVFEEKFQELLNVQEKKLSQLKNYFEAVNSFFQEKKLSIPKNYTDIQDEPNFVEFPNGRRTSIRTLSSGERQLVSLFFSVYFDNEESRIILIDEPELSLHIDWQRQLITAMKKKLGNKQIIVCTHSPEIGADFIYENKIRNLDCKECK